MSTLSPSQLAERRSILPIYKSLETQNYKSGLSNVQKSLVRIKSGPNYHLLLALHVRLLLVSGADRKEAARISLTLEGMHVEDEEALKWMRVNMTDLGRGELFPLLAAYAFEKNPTDGGLGMMLCMSYVRVRDWKGVQKSAFKLHGSFEDPRTVYWSALSLYLQATYTPLSSNPSLPLNLSHRLLSPTAGSSPRTPSHIYLYIQVLLSLAQTSNPPNKSHLQEAYAYLERRDVQIISGENLEVEELRWEVARLLGGLQGRTTDVEQGGKDDENEGGSQSNREVGKVVETGGVWATEWERLKARVQGSDTKAKDFNHLTYLHLIDLAYLLHPSNPTILESTRELFAALDLELGSRSRSPFLAALKLNRRGKGRSDVSGVDERAFPLIRVYLILFSTKACCFEDLKPFLPTSPTQTSELVTLLRSNLEVSRSIRGDAKTLQTQINAYKILRYLVPPLDASNLTQEDISKEQDLVKELCQLYSDGLVIGKDLPKTDLQPVDDLAILAVNVLVSLFRLTNSLTYLHTAYSLLSLSLLSSPQNHYLRLLLIPLLRLIACPSLSISLFCDLKITAIQFDTLSHVCLTRATTAGSLNAGGGKEEGVYREVIEKAARYFGKNELDTPEMIITAFSEENYPQVPDFLTFYNRLSSSLQRRILQLESLRKAVAERAPNELNFADLLSPTAVEDLSKRPKTEVLSDNRDFKLMPSYQPRGSPTTEELLRMGPLVDERWIRIMNAVYLLILSAAEKQDLKKDLVARLTSAISLELDAESLTEDELALAKLALALYAWSREPLTKAAEGKQITEFFSHISSRIDILSSSCKTVGWQVIHVASTALEAYIFFDLLTYKTLNPPAKPKKAKASSAASASSASSPTSPSTLLSEAKTSLRSIATSLTTLANAASSASTRSSLKTDMLPSLVMRSGSNGDASSKDADEDRLLEYASALSGSRKAALMGLVKRIEERVGTGDV